MRNCMSNCEKRGSGETGYRWVHRLPLSHQAAIEKSLGLAPGALPGHYYRDVADALRGTPGAHLVDEVMSAAEKSGCVNGSGVATPVNVATRRW